MLIIMYILLYFEGWVLIFNFLKYLMICSSSQYNHLRNLFHEYFIINYILKILTYFSTYGIFLHREDTVTINI